MQRSRKSSRRWCIQATSKRRLIVVDTTTVHPSTTSSITQLLTENGASFIAAPVFGSTPVAQAGQLIMAVAGPESAIQRISPLLKGVMARAVIQAGEEPSKAVVLKTTSNYLTAGLMYLISEAHTLAEKVGLPASVLEELVEKNFGQYAYGRVSTAHLGSIFPCRR